MNPTCFIRFLLKCSNFSDELQTIFSPRVKFNFAESIHLGIILEELGEPKWRKLQKHSYNVTNLKKELTFSQSCKKSNITLRTYSWCDFLVKTTFELDGEDCIKKLHVRTSILIVHAYDLSSFAGPLCLWLIKWK